MPTILRQDKTAQRESALQRIRALFDAAALAFANSPAQAHKLVAQAYQLLLRSKAKLPTVLKRRMCRKCRSLWVPGKTVRVRMGGKKVVYTCLVCKHMRRVPIISH